MSQRKARPSKTARRSGGVVFSSEAELNEFVVRTLMISLWTFSMDLMGYVRRNPDKSLEESALALLRSGVSDLMDSLHRPLRHPLTPNEVEVLEALGLVRRLPTGESGAKPS